MLVIDDGSRDGTSSAAQEAGAKVITSLVNRGKGAAIRLGFDWVSKNGFEGVIVMDADGQHDPHELEGFLRALVPTKADLVIGNRMHHPKGMPLIRRVTNHFMSLIVSLFAGRWIPDSQCGYRALTQEALNRMKLKTDRFEIESEMLLEASRRKLKIVSIPVASVYRGETSHIRPVQDTLRFFSFLLRFIFLH